MNIPENRYIMTVSNPYRIIISTHLEKISSEQNKFKIGENYWIK